MFAWILRGKVLEFWRGIFPLLSMEISNLSKVFFSFTQMLQNYKKRLKEDFFLQVDWAVGQCGKPFRNRHSFEEWHVFWQIHGNSLSCSLFSFANRDPASRLVCVFCWLRVYPNPEILVRTGQQFTVVWNLRSENLATDKSASFAFAWLLPLLTHFHGPKYW